MQVNGNSNPFQFQGPAETQGTQGANDKGDKNGLLDKIKDLAQKLGMKPEELIKMLLDGGKQAGESGGAPSGGAPSGGGPEGPSGAKEGGAGGLMDLLDQLMKNPEALEKLNKLLGSEKGKGKDNTAGKGFGQTDSSDTSAAAYQNQAQASVNPGM